VSEPISPELVLVDPELARRVRATPDPATSWELRPAPLAPPPSCEGGLVVREPTRVTATRLARARHFAGRVVLVAVGAAIMASGYGTATAMFRQEVDVASFAPADPVPAAVTPSEAASPAVVTSGGANGEAKPTNEPRARAGSSRRTAPRSRSVADAASAPRLEETSGSVERRLLALIIASPAGKLPASLIDPATGLARGNLQAVCRPSVEARSFVCVVRSAGEPGRGEVWVQYARAAGRPRFTWYGPRR
jgi:hypothetical protein